MFPDSARFFDYLRAKATVDDRALNHTVWLDFASALSSIARREREGDSILLLDLGAGIGCGVTRMLDRQLFRDWPPSRRIEWMLVDRSAEALDEARNQLIPLLDRTMTVHFKTGDITAFARAQTAPFHAVIGHALLDMLDLDESLNDILNLIAPGGIGYFPICFDGVTIFEPGDELDDAVLQSFHRSMDPNGVGKVPRSHTGRSLIQRLRQEPVTLLGVGSSDWIVYATDGAYRHREGDFVAAILELVERAVADAGDIAPSDLGGWLRRRRAQLDAAELTYIAHQMDYLLKKA